MRREAVFCACAPGLEPTLAAELVALGLAARAVPVRLWRGPARDLPAGKREARRRVGAGVELHVRTEGGAATISADAAGAPLFRRGWRARVGAAPLRESIAAGILLACGFEGERPFLDPMCGSGTLAIEAALAAGRRAPGLGRTFAFEAFAGHDAARTARLRASLAARARPVAVPIHASDRNAGALRLARKNAEAAGVADALTFAREDAASLAPPPGPGLCATNPPWGVRLDEAAADAWRALAALLPRLAGWDVAVLGPDRGFERLLPAAPVATTALRNGGVACRLLRYAP